MKRVLLGVGAGVVAAVIGAGCGNPPQSCRTDAECPPQGYCDQSIMGGACVARYESLVVRNPVSAGTVSGATQTLDVELVAHPGLPRNDPAAIDYTLRGPDGGTLAGGQLSSAGGGRYQAAWTPGPEGPHELAVSFQGLAATSQFAVDKTPPAIAVLIPPPPASARPGGTSLTDRDTAAGFSDAWRRDETLPVEVRSNASDLDTANVDVVIFGISQDGGVGAAQAAVKASAMAQCDASYCGLAQLPLWQPPMQAFRGDMVVQVLGPDRVGNVTDAGVRAKVTRWKWDYNPAAGAIRTAPAIGSTGKIYFAPNNSPGRVHALTPSGAESWPPAVVPTVASTVAVGAPDAGFEPVYVGTTGTGGRLLALNGADGGLIGQCGSTGDIQTGLAVGTINVGLPVEVAVGVLNGVASEINGIRTAGGCLTTANAANSAPASSVAMKGSDIYYGGDLGFIEARTFTGSWAPKAGWPTDAGIESHALAIVAGEVVGGGRGRAATDAVYAIPETGGPFWKLALAAESWNPAILGTDRVVIGLNGAVLHSVTVRNSASATTAAIGGVARGAPVLGHGNLLYVGTTVATVLALSASTLATQWQVDLPDAVEASMAIDCMRDATGQTVGGKPLGVLYAPSINGHLYAFIVDSAGLDTSSAWPKYQHDPRNTGNADTNLAQFACPP